MEADGKTYKWRMIFYPLYLYLTDKLGEWSKPLIGCYKCYASFWGTILFWTTTAFSVRTEMIRMDFLVLIPMWIIYCFSLVVVNVLLEKITDDQ